METDTSLLVAILVLVSVMFIVMLELTRKVNAVYYSTNCADMLRTEVTEFKRFLP